ncbi:hypothetical protein M976_00268 [Buttiauxella ferragutiae ATCC 51602]|uniref:Uncharacterized protein n=1 Tax=Buttiauxella ferragutiae ATCC 51602 TaxID=1354252 RepID=A0ABX2WEF9_9ENTR|nr:hypothetical protein [Buttiauxella ferragutiae]OAT33520.1 hypothetical protein M976_00268 [Buttiauxella ferragutiae ATCC 51602]
MKTSHLLIVNTQIYKLLFLKNTDSKMKKNRIIKTLKLYGFVEVSELTHYINSIEEDYIGYWDAKFVCDRLCYCLERHGSEGDFFIPLKSLISELNSSILIDKFSVR